MPRANWWERLSVVPRVARLERLVDRMERRMGRLEDAIAVVNEATNQVAATVDDLRRRIESGDTTAVTALTEVSTRLRSIAADPANPGGDPA